MHHPGHTVTAAMLRTKIKETHCISQNAHTHARTHTHTHTHTGFW